MFMSLSYDNEGVEGAQVPELSIFHVCLKC